MASTAKASSLKQRPGGKVPTDAPSTSTPAVKTKPKAPSYLPETDPLIGLPDETQKALKRVLGVHDEILRVDRPAFDLEYFFVRGLFVVLAAAAFVLVPHLILRLGNAERWRDYLMYGVGAVLALTLYYVHEFLGYRSTTYMFTEHKVAVVQRMPWQSAWTVVTANYLAIAGVQSETEGASPGHIYFNVVVGGSAEDGELHTKKTRSHIDPRCLAYIYDAADRAKMMRQYISMLKLARYEQRVKTLPLDVLEPRMKARLERKMKREEIMVEERKGNPTT